MRKTCLAQYFTATYAKQIILLCLITSGLLHSASSLGQGPAPYNPGTKVSFVRTWEAQLPQPNSPPITPTITIDSFIMTTQYLDGLGRPLQTVTKAFSPYRKDLVSPVVYDTMGREKYQFLPFAANSTGGNPSTNDGLFKFNPFQQQKIFYDNYLTGQAESNYYTYNNYEASPLNRLAEVYGPGKNWSGTSAKPVEVDRHGVDYRYGTNRNNDSVLLWTVTDGPAGTFGTYSAVLYQPGVLTRMVTEDEHGGEVVEFKDRNGRIVLKKVLLTAARDVGWGTNGLVGWLCTYYMYDNTGNLRCVLQPEGTKMMWNPPVVTILSDSIIAEQCFRYAYDSRQRLIMKKLPGAGMTEMVYDKRDRMIFSRDSLQKVQGYWSLFKYDSLNRVVKIALNFNSFTRARHQDSCNANINYPTVNGGEVMQENYYDNYSWFPVSPPTAITSTINGGDFVVSFFDTNYNKPPLYAQAIIPDYLNVKGMLTGSKVRTMGTFNFLMSINFYDAFGRLIQTQSQNIGSSYDYVTTQYDFSGKALRQLHRNSVYNATIPRYTRELTKYGYDHAGRVTSIKKKIGATGADIAISENSYSEIGQLKTKKLGTNIETQDFEYNVRGWNIGVNRGYIRGDSVRKFGYELGYDNNQIGIASGNTYARPQYNGNIGGLVWKSVGDNQVACYDYNYDATNRLKAADFYHYTSGYFNKLSGIDFTVNGLAYDENGNIKAMNQTGWKQNSSSYLDKLVYTYLPKSNKLAKVLDSISDPTSKLGDFKDGTNIDNDYAYDVNGNLTVDKNKGISAITYNHRNLPTEISIPGKGKISYVYNFLGEKLKKIIVDSAYTPTPKITTWMYIKNFVFKNDTIEFFNHEDGRARYDTAQKTNEATAFKFDYFVKDHLGNIRMVLTEEKETLKYEPLTFEDYRVADQNTQWDNKSGASIDVIGSRTSVPGGMDAAFGQKFMLVRKSMGAIGAAKLLKVMAGDSINVIVDYIYTTVNANNTGASGISSLVYQLATAIGASGQVGADLKSGAISITSALSGIGSLVGLLNTSNATSGSNNAPKAYLNVLFFDDQFKYVSAIVKAVAYNPNLKGSINLTGLMAPIASKNGFVYLYFSNESDEMVYFDNFLLNHVKGPILEETHYYPFGLTMAGISSQALLKPENRTKFQSQEFTSDLDVNYYEFKYRVHDPQLGRFIQIDPLADKYVHNSTYAFSENKVTGHVELEGLEAWSIQNDENGSTKVYGPYRNKSAAQTAYNSDYSTQGGEQFINSEGMIVGNRVTENRIAKLERGDISPNVEGVILHRTVSSSSESTLNSFADRGVGTHFLVGKDGKVYQTASLNSKTSHLRESQVTNDKLSNATAIGIEVVGNYDSKNEKWDAVTVKQEKAVSGLVNSLLKTFNLTNANIFNHEEIQPKTKGEGKVVFDSIKKYLNNSTSSKSSDELPIPLTNF